jgi:hypothetical protein
MNYKAQFWSFDVIFAVVIFSFAITVLAFTWFSINNQLSTSYSNVGGIMQTQLQTLSQNLFSQGNPQNWQSAVNVTNSTTWSGISVGLAATQGSYVISPSKLYTFMSMSNYNYKATKQAFGIGYDYYITITSNPNIGSGINFSIGRSPFNNGALTIYVNKLGATINGVPVVVNMMIWSNVTAPS